MCKQRKPVILKSNHAIFEISCFMNSTLAITALILLVCGSDTPNAEFLGLENLVVAIF